MAGTLYVVATPIGNLEDITVRAIRILLMTPVIACEDTRHTGILIKLLRERYRSVISNFEFLISKQKFISVRDWNEASVVDRIMDELMKGDVALVSDAGTPLISDPGYKVVRTAREAGFTVSPIPGPAAVLAALSVAGLPTNKFVFLGFVKDFELFSGFTHVIYENPVRLTKLLGKIAANWPEAEIVVAWEMTKVHERITDDVLGITENLKGEVTVVVYLPAEGGQVGEKVSADHGHRGGQL